MTAYRDLLDEDLLELLKFGDHAAFEEIYKRYWGIIFCHARKMLSSDEEAKDLLQDLFVNLWQKSADLNIQGSLSAYLYGSVRYKVFNLFDKRKVREKHIQSLGTFLEHAECTTDNTVRENELSRLIEREIAVLPAKMREVFELSRKSHLSYQQISRQMKISDQTVKKQIYNAVKILRLKFGSI
ncbi:RNA polymerase sigma factor [Pedobacter sp. PWIIR3]